MNNFKRRVIVSAIIERDDKFLFTQQGRARHAGFWAFPGGGLEFEESNLIDALKREVREEVGVEIKNEKLLDASVFLNLKDNLQLVAIFFKAELAVGEPKISEEIADFKWLTLEELKAFSLDQIRPPVEWYGDLLLKIEKC